MRNQIPIRDDKTLRRRRSNMTFAKNADGGMAAHVNTMRPGIVFYYAR